MKDALIKKAIGANLRRLVASAIELSALLEKKMLKASAMYSRRTIGELLLHLALIPREQILMMRGQDREKILKGATIATTKDFARILKASVKYFEKELDDVHLEANVRVRGRSFVALDWITETLTHFAGHRDQIYFNVMAQGKFPTRKMLSNLFVSHPPMTPERYRLVNAAMQRFYENSCAGRN